MESVSTQSGSVKSTTVLSTIKPDTIPLMPKRIQIEHPPQHQALLSNQPL